eukprot:1196061-Prorocentrum_minimum.AAC.7
MPMPLKNVDVDHTENYYATTLNQRREPDVDHTVRLLLYKAVQYFCHVFCHVQDAFYLILTLNLRIDRNDLVKAIASYNIKTNIKEALSPSFDKCR